MNEPNKIEFKTVKEWEDELSSYSFTELESKIEYANVMLLYYRTMKYACHIVQDKKEKSENRTDLPKC